MKSTALALAGLMAATLPAAAETATSPPPTNVAAPEGVSNRAIQTFVDQATMINRLEIEAAQAAKKKTNTPAYQDYADMIVTDHTNMDHDLLRIVGRMAGIRMPDGPDQQHQQKLERMSAEAGAQFERSYRQNQIDGHHRAIKLFQDFANGGSDNADLKSWAQASLPILQKHLQRAENLPNANDRVGAVGGDGRTTAMTDRGASNNVAADDRRSATTGKANSSQNGVQGLVNEAVGMVRKMQADPQVAELMKKAKGIYFVPDFGRGAVVVGVRGGSGLVTVKENGKWSDPAFYDLGGISVGPQVGASGGQVAFLLMSQGAVDVFKRGNKFSLNAGAGLSIVNYSANSQASWGKGDVVMWSDTAGAYVGATISVSDIDWAGDNNRQYYGQNVDIQQILNRNVDNAGADALTSALSG
jgi:lipid-binding SYLF domain-containing protein/predicted outer membrane protein